ncbi:hypothetical protein MZM54_02470 [[Brevibacterium] frigoritolerans]|nr:hypothetical protein [Peribacillus frigoritolerans]
MKNHKQNTPPPLPPSSRYKIKKNDIEYTKPSRTNTLSDFDILQSAAYIANPKLSSVFPIKQAD